MVGDVSSNDPGERAPSSHHGVGYRFRRPLSEAELDTIREAATQPGKTGTLDGAFRHFIGCGDTSHLDARCVARVSA